MLIREESLATVPLIFLAALIYWHITRKTRLISLLLFILICTITSITLYAYASWVIPSDSMGTLNLVSYFTAIFLTFTGLQSFNLISKIIIYGWFIIYLVVLCLAILSKNKPMLNRAFVYLICIPIVCVFALKTVRSNLLLLPLTLLAYHFTALLLAAKSKIALWKYINPVIIGFVILGCLYVSSWASLAYNPASTYVIDQDGDFIYGKFAASTIPEERIVTTKKLLSQYDINNEDEFQAFRGKLKHATVFKKHSPDQSGELFFPFLNPFADYEMSIFNKIRIFGKGQ